MGNTVSEEQNKKSNVNNENIKKKDELLYTKYISIKKISLGDTTEFDHLWACLVQHSFAIIEMDDKATLFTNLNDFRNKITEFWKLSYDIKKKI